MIRQGLRTLATSAALKTSKPLKQRKLKSTVSLSEFLFRQKLKEVYRDVLRLIYKSHQKDDLLAFAKEEFRAGGVNATNEKAGDLGHRKYLLNIGVARINDMLNVMGISSDKFRNI